MDPISAMMVATVQPSFTADLMNGIVTVAGSIVPVAAFLWTLVFAFTAIDKKAV